MLLWPATDPEPNKAPQEIKATNYSGSCSFAVLRESAIVGDASIVRSAANEATERFFETKGKR